MLTATQSEEGSVGMPMRSLPLRGDKNYGAKAGEMRGFDKVRRGM